MGKTDLTAAPNLKPIFSMRVYSQSLGKRELAERGARARTLHLNAPDAVLLGDFREALADDQAHRASARFRSPIKSSGCSIPTLRRISPSVTPAGGPGLGRDKAVRGAGRVAGQAVHIAQGHGLGEQFARRLSTCAAAARSLRASSNDTMPPNPPCNWRCASACWGWPGQTGVVHGAHGGVRG
jgi:hypothetical protein